MISSEAVMSFRPLSLIICIPLLFECDVSMENFTCATWGLYMKMLLLNYTCIDRKIDL